MSAQAELRTLCSYHKITAGDSSNPQKYLELKLTAKNLKYAHPDWIKTLAFIMKTSLTCQNIISVKYHKLYKVV